MSDAPQHSNKGFKGILLNVLGLQPEPTGPSAPPQTSGFDAEAGDALLSVDSPDAQAADVQQNQQEGDEFSSRLASIRQRVSSNAWYACKLGAQLTQC